MPASCRKRRLSRIRDASGTSVGGPLAPDQWDVTAAGVYWVSADLGPEPGVADGIKVDTAGNVYSGGSGGLYILDARGRKLGRIVHGEAATTNMAFGGDDWKTLFVCAHDSIYVRRMKVPGQPHPYSARFVR